MSKKFVVVGASTSNIGGGTNGNTNNPFDSDVIDASIRNSERDENEVDFSLYVR